LKRLAYHFVVFRRQLKDASQLGIHEVIGLRIFPLVEEEERRRRRRRGETAVLFIKPNS